MLSPKTTIQQTKQLEHTCTCALRIIRIFLIVLTYTSTCHHFLFQRQQLQTVGCGSKNGATCW